MKVSTFILFIFSLFYLEKSCAQVSINYLLSREPEFREKYEIQKDINGIKVNMNFADDSILNPGVVKRLKGLNILMIDLVYTDYRSVKTFDQPVLNLKRMQHLQKILPEAFKNSAIIWNFIAQTGCNSSEGCKDYFHGFAIYYRPKPTALSVSTELAKLECSTKRTTYWDTIKKYKVVSSYTYLPRSKSKADQGIRYTRRSIFFRKEVIVFDTVPLKRPRMRKRVVTTFEGDCPMDTAISKKPVSLVSSAFVWGNDSVVTAVLNRNKEWKNMVISVDVTGSMSPYTQQVYQWIALQSNLSRVRSFTFFNDGNSTPDHLKFAGHTGGIYDCTKLSFDHIMNSCNKAMRNGNGGDGPENDVESILHIQDEFKNVKEVILIADNFANMRDFKLIEKIQVPVRVILCGASWGVNSEYLKLARSTGGSVHTMEQDLNTLANMMEGETIKIGKQKYKLQKGEFVLTP
ncbi:MAG: hypothetical protein KG003_11050 [Bacteroidetes bacterium]|nr:hypothetical protein [Bacteroidota bacterium]